MNVVTAMTLLFLMGCVLLQAGIVNAPSSERRLAAERGRTS